MAISSSTRKAGPFIGNDATTVFPFAFKVFTAADLRVVNTSALGVESDLVIDVDYTVSLNSNQDNDPGGSVTRLTALPTGQRLTITSDVEALQPLVLTNNGGFYPRVINDAFDKITIIAQQLIEQVGRSLKLPISSSASATLPDPVANRLIAWNSSANGFTNVDPASIATVAAYADANLELFNGNGTQTAFTLAQDPAVLANLDVSISGVTQVGGEDFTWIGTTLTFLVAPPNGTRIQVRYTRAIPPADLAAAVAAAEADRVATAADRVQTGLDRVATAADVVSAEADRVATAADRVATAADRVQTGLDRVATAADVVSAEAALAAALALTPASAYSLAAIAETSPGVGGASYPATVKAVQIQHREPSYALPSTLRGKPFKIARLSKADIDSAGVYPARAVVRTADRFMPDGSTDATNGGYWVIADAVLCAEMFGQLHLNHTETTATLRAFHEMAYWTGRPGLWTGDAYTINGPLLFNSSRATGSLHITREGPVTVTVAGGTTPMTAVIFARTAAVSSITLDGAPLEINAATLAACGVQIGHDGGGSYDTVGGHCKVRGITGKNLLAAAGESAAAVTIIGPYDTYDIEDNHAYNVNRAPNGLTTGGECKGIAVSEAKRACVMRRCTATNIYAQDDRDADGFAIFGPVAAGTGYALCPLAAFEYCVASGAEGRSIKSQTAHTRVLELQASRSNSIGSGAEIDAQYGSLEVDGADVTISGAVGASYSVVAPQGQRPSPAPLYSRIERVSVKSSVILPRMVAATRGANYARHSILFANNSGSRTDDPAASLWSRGVIEVSLADARAASTLLDINAVDNLFPTLRPMFTYTGDNGTDPSAGLALRGSGNRNILTVNDGGQAFLASISGTTISKFAAYTPGINPGFHQVFETWYVDWDTIQHGAVYDVNLATFTQANGPSGLPASGYARIKTGQGERGWYTHFEREIEVLTTGQVFRKTLSNWNASAPMVKGAAVADAAGATPTKAEFDALLASLRTAKVIAT